MPGAVSSSEIRRVPSIKWGKTIAIFSEVPMWGVVAAPWRTWALKIRRPYVVLGFHTHMSHNFMHNVFPTPKKQNNYLGTWLPRGLPSKLPRRAGRVVYRGNTLKNIFFAIRLRERAFGAENVHASTTPGSHQPPYTAEPGTRRTCLEKKIMKKLCQERFRQVKLDEFPV